RSASGTAAPRLVPSSWPSRAAREPREVRLALLEERSRTLVRLVRRVVEAGRVAGELLQPGQTVGRDQERGLQEPDRCRAHGEDLGRPGHTLGFELREWDDVVHEAHLQGGRGVVPAAEEPDLLGLAVTDEARKEANPEARVEAPDLRADLPEDRVLG